MADLKKLICKRGNLKGQLTRFSTLFIDSIECFVGNKIRELQTRLERVELLLNEFNEIQFEIECLDELEAVTEERNNFEQSFYKTLGIARVHIVNYKVGLQAQLQKEPLEQGTKSNPKTTGDLSLINSVKLPILNLPRFYGDYDKWTQFQETFLALVHNNPCLDDIQRFYYLLDCLKGDAEKVLMSFTLGTGN